MDKSELPMEDPLMNREVVFNVDTDEDSPLLQKAPRDQWNAVYIAMFLEGVGTLFPWNAFITVTNYFEARLSNSRFEHNFENYFTFIFQAFNISVLMLAMKYQQNISLAKRILIPFALQFIVFTTMTVLVKVNSISPDGFFGVTVGLVIISASASSFVQGGLFGLAGCLPPRHMQAFMSGQGLSGVAVALLNLLSLGVNDGDPESAALMFFSISVVLILLCLGGFLFLQRQPLVRHYLGVAAHHRELSRRASVADPNVSEISTSGVSQLVVFKKVWPLAMALLLQFCCTLSVFPGIIARINATSGSEKYRDIFFVPIMCFVVFNVTDFIGRLAAGWFQFPSFRYYRWLLWIALIRFGLVPIFMFCNVQLGGPRSFPVSLDSDVYPYVFVVVLGLTNGYFGSMSMIHGPKLTDPGEMESAGSMLAWFLTVGLLAGTLVSFGLKGIICSCNPFA